MRAGGHEFQARRPEGGPLVESMDKRISKRGLQLEMLAVLDILRGERGRRGRARKGVILRAERRVAAVIRELAASRMVGERRHG